MIKIRHKGEHTTAAIRREIRKSQDSLRTLASRYGINPKTVAKWKHRASPENLPKGPSEPHSTTLSPEDERIIVSFRQHTLLPLDDCLYAIQLSIPYLSRSSLYRCLRRHGLNRLGNTRADFTSTHPDMDRPGHFYMDITETMTIEGKRYVYVATDTASKFAFMRAYSRSTGSAAAAFLVDLIEAMPYKIDTILTDESCQYTASPTQHPYRTHLFALCCRENGVTHRRSNRKHRRDDGHTTDHINQSLDNMPVRNPAYSSHDGLVANLESFARLYNYRCRLKALGGRTPYEHIGNIWGRNPELFHRHPHHRTLELV